MQKTIAILFLAALLIFSQSKTKTFADDLSLNANNHISAGHDATGTEISDDSKININSSSSAHRAERDNEDENEIEDDGINGRVISAKTPLLQNVSPTSMPSTTISPTPSTTPAPTVSPSASPTPGVQPSLETSGTESASANFDFIKELEKLLLSLKKIVFNALG